MLSGRLANAARPAPAAIRTAPRARAPRPLAASRRDEPTTGLLPRRDPGAFPSPSLTSALERLSFELLEGADTGAPAAAGAEEAPYDPLRDGPARYLGYSNECG